MHALRVLVVLCIVGAAGDEAPYLANPCLRAPFASLPFCDTSLSFAARVADAISRLDAAEKTACLASQWPSLPSLGLPAYNW